MYESRHAELQAFIQDTNQWLANVKRDSQDEEDDVTMASSASHTFKSYISTVQHQFG